MFNRAAEPQPGAGAELNWMLRTDFPILTQEAKFPDCWYFPKRFLQSFCSVTQLSLFCLILSLSIELLHKLLIVTASTKAGDTQMTRDHYRLFGSWQHGHHRQKSNISGFCGAVEDLAQALRYAVSLLFFKI